MRFAELADMPDREIDLAAGALLIASDEYPDLDIPSWLRHLDRLAEGLQPRLADLGNDFERLQRLTGYLYGEVGLRGNDEEYYDPRNSFLNDVLERRLGIPITLAIVCMEVGQRVGVPLLGIGFPGHFLLRHAYHPELFLDPFESAALLPVSECAELLQRVGGGKIAFDRQLLQPSTPRQILKRLLYNLRGIYLDQRRLDKAVTVIGRLISIDPDEPTHRRDRGLLLVHRGDPAGIEDLETYLAGDPPDRKSIESLLADARAQLDPIH